MDMVIQVQIPDQAVCISHSAKLLGKVLVQLSPAMSKL